MLNEVKVLMDEQSRQSLNCLKEDFAEILRPLNQLNELGYKMSGFIESNNEFCEESRKKMTALSNDISSVRKKSDEAIEYQQENSKKLSAILSEITEFKKALECIDWND